MKNFDSAYSDIKSKNTVYKKEYPFNLSTQDTPTGQMRVFINNEKPNRSSQFLYFPKGN